MRIGTGYDVHQFEAGRKLILGGVEIDHPRGLAGHSDADVLVHAVMDAILGALGLGDIGMHFPDTDPRWKDARSLDLMKAVRERLARKGATVVNVDATVIAEAPKLAPHRDAMRENLARALDVAPDAISVKFTTVEELGALGREEGIAAMAVAVVSLESEIE